MDGKRQPIIDMDEVVSAFGRDVDFHDVYPLKTYLDRSKGQVIWVYQNDEDAESEIGMPTADNQEYRERVAAYPDQFLEIPGLSHAEHHEILKEFLRLDWTDDQAQKEAAEKAYLRSIGGWKHEVGEAVFDTFINFKNEKIRHLARVFLQRNGLSALSN